MAVAGRRPARTLEGAVPGTWKALYDTDLVGVYALIVVPVIFLLWLVLTFAPARDAVGRFMGTWALVFTVVTIVDPLVTGFGVRWLGLEGSYELILIPFVLVGDFRVFLLLCRLRAPERGLGRAIVEAAAWTLVVPAAAWAVHAALREAWPDLPSAVLWLVYETFFTILALAWRAWLVPGHGYLRAVLAYVAAYYVLWAAADVLILAGADVGWGLRVVPNLLYYDFWVPFAYGLFFWRRYDSTSTSTQTLR
jgi:hypothetical protein